MKTRQGFVSNSSSSSFIVAFDKTNDAGKCQLTLEVDMSKYGTRLSSKEELDDYIIGEYGTRGITIEKVLEDDWYDRDRYNKMLEAINAGKVIFAGWASYNETDDPIEMMIGNGGLKYITGTEVIEYDA